MVTPLNKLAQYWRDDANNANLALTPQQRDAMRECADELQQSFAQFRKSKRFFANKGDSEANFIADGASLDCPHCGGHGFALAVRRAGQ